MRAPAERKWSVKISGNATREVVCALPVFAHGVIHVEPCPCGTGIRWYRDRFALCRARRFLLLRRKNEESGKNV